jgi:hypothetical protein
MKKYIGIGLAFAVLICGGLMVSAEDNAATEQSAEHVSGPMMVNIGPGGNAMLRGTVDSLGANSLDITSWGGTWTVAVNSSTQILSANKLLSDFKEGDIVGVLGKVTADGDFVIEARIVREWGRRNDADKDGIPDNQDLDEDNDGVENHMDMKRMDHDNDGIIDSQDTDDDNDGILDTADKFPFDSNNDGIPDFRMKHPERNEMMNHRGPGRGGDDEEEDDNSSGN